MTDSEAKTKTTQDEEQVIELLRHPVDLYKILKFEGLVGSGGEAKAAIAEGQVVVDNVVETLKRKKIVSGDTIRFRDRLYRMHCDAPLEIKPPHQEKKPEATEKPKEKKKDWRKRTVARKVASKKAKKSARKAIGIKS